MSTNIHFGRILANHTLRTPDGDFFLSSATTGQQGSPKQQPFASAREREGQFVVIKGEINGDVILDCSLIEAVPPITSQIIARILDENEAIKEQILLTARQVRDELVGQLPPIPEPHLPIEVIPSGPLPLCVIDIGHSPVDSGACGRHQQQTICEFAFNTELAAMIEPLVKQARIITINRHPEGYAHLPAKTNTLNPNFVVSLHANASEPSANGSEVLYFRGSTEGRRLAGILQSHFTKALGLRHRGIKARTSADRGGSQLVNTRAPIVIGEPFFLTNPGDIAVALAKKRALATAYASAIDEYATLISQPDPTQTSKRNVGSPLASNQPFQFVAADLTKEKFLSNNKAELERLLAAINLTLGSNYGQNFIPLTRQDIWVLTYCEAGLRHGKVDPDHRHSQGERGMLPLPANVKFWNGPGAPAWDRPMPLARNLEQFFLYLGNIKNKPVTNIQNRMLYRDLFKVEEIAGNPTREAKLLAGIVHGYFYSGAYTDRKVPVDQLIDGYRSDIGPALLLQNTTYLHAGKPLLRNRETNVNAALQLI